MAECSDYDVTFFYSEDETEEDQDAIESLLGPIKAHCKESGFKCYDPHKDARLGQTVISTRVIESLKSKSTLVFLSKTADNSNADKFFRQVLHLCNINKGQAEKFAVIFIGNVDIPEELSVYHTLCLQEDGSNRDDIIQKVQEFLKHVGSSEDIFSEGEQEVLNRSQAKKKAAPNSPPGRAYPVLGEGDLSLEVDSPPVRVQEPNRSSTAPRTRHSSANGASPPPRSFRPQPAQNPPGGVPPSDLDASDLEEEGVNVPQIRVRPDGRETSLPRSTAAEGVEEETQVQRLVSGHDHPTKPMNPEGQQKVSLWQTFTGFFTSFDG